MAAARLQLVMHVFELKVVDKCDVNAVWPLLAVATFS